MSAPSLVILPKGGMMRIAWFLAWGAALFAQPNQKATVGVDIPRPSGPYAIGRVSYDWIDSSRPESLSKTPNTPREIVVDVWYPAVQPQPGVRLAPYFPNAEKIDKSPYAQAEKRDLGNLWAMIASGRVPSHTYENVPVVSTQSRFPLLIFSHAIGSEPYLYAHQIEDLVSHGFIVATIHHTYEVAVAVFGDGRMIPFS
jgi:hypothetical protein